MTKQVFFYDRATGELVGEAPADLSPIQTGDPDAEGYEPDYLVPAWATMVVPPEVPNGQAAVWRDEAWSLVPDQRGRVYWLADGSRHQVTELGQVVPSDALTEPPPPTRDQALANVLALLRTVRGKMFTILDVARIDFAAEAVAIMANPPGSTQEERDAAIAAAADLVARAKQTAVDLRDITKTTVPAQATTERAITLVFMARYRDIVAAAPAPLIPAFTALAAELAGVAA